MNKNDKFQVAEFEVSARTVTDEKLEAVSGGNAYTQICWYCNMKFPTLEEMRAHVKICPLKPKYIINTTQNS